MYQFNNLFYLNQGNESEDYVTETYLKNIAGQVTGLNANTAWDNRNNPKATHEISKAADLAAQNGVSGTPTVFVGATEDSATKVDLQDLTDPSAIVDAVNALQ
jgi:protein-disulfide isomerase